MIAKLKFTIIIFLLFAIVLNILSYMDYSMIGDVIGDVINKYVSP